MNLEQFQKEFVNTLTHVDTINAVVKEYAENATLFAYSKDEIHEVLYDIENKKKVNLFLKQNLIQKIFGIRKRDMKLFGIYKDYGKGYSVFTTFNTYYTANTVLKKYSKKGLISAIRNKLKLYEKVIVILGDYTYLITRNV